MGIRRDDLLRRGLVVFGPAKMGQMARDVGEFAYGARGSWTTGETNKAEQGGQSEKRR